MQSSSSTRSSVASRGCVRHGRRSRSSQRSRRKEAGEAAAAACRRQRTFVAVGIAFYGLCLSAIVGCGHLRCGFGHTSRLPVGVASFNTGQQRVERPFAIWLVIVSMCSTYGGKKTKLLQMSCHYLKWSHNLQLLTNYLQCSASCLIRHK